MSQKTRKERQQELREIEKKNEELENNALYEKTDELIFKEQKQRLRKQLNDVPVISIDASDTVKPNRMQTRMEIKKQKKIDDILKDIAVLPEDKYLDEDTNLRILRNLSVHKQYNRLQLSPEQEEKMLENKERFDTITNQLWFLINELDSKNVKEPELGQVPTVSSKNSNNIKVRQERKFFDIEQELADAQAAVESNVFTKKKEQKEMHISDHIEEKLGDITLKEDGELTMVLEELDRIIQDDKKIVREEIQQQTEHVGSIPPQDTMELLELLQELEDAKQSMGVIDLTGEKKDIIEEASKITAKQGIIGERAETDQNPKVGAKKEAPTSEVKAEILTTPVKEAVPSSEVKKVESTVDVKKSEPKVEVKEETKGEEKKSETNPHPPQKDEKSEVKKEEVKLPQSIEIDLEKAGNTTMEATYKTIDLTQFTLSTEQVQEESEKVQPAKKTEPQKAVSKPEPQKVVSKPEPQKVEKDQDAVKTTQENKNKETDTNKRKVKEESIEETIDTNNKTKIETEVEEVVVTKGGNKQSRLQNSILVTALIFVGLLIVFIIYVIYLIMVGQMTF